MHYFSSLKKTLIVATLAAVLLVAPQPVSAQGFSPSSLIDGVRNQVQRLFLRVVPGPKSGEAVLQQALSRSESLTSVTYNSQINVAAQSENAQDFTAELAVSGPVEIINVYDPASQQQQIDITGTVSAEGTSFTTDANLVMAHEMLYVKFNTVPALPNIDLASLKDRWFQFDAGSSQSMMEEKPEVTELTEEQRQAYKEAFDELLAGAVISEARRERQNGQSVFVIDVTLPDEAILAYSQRVADIGQPQDAAMSELYKAELEKNLADLDPVAFTVWVSTKSFYPVHLETTFAMSPEKFGGVATAEQPVDEVQVNLMVDFSEFNQPVSVEVPAEAEDGLTAVMGVMPGLSGLGSGPAMNQKELELMESMMMQSEPTTGVPELPELSPEQMELLEQYGF